VCVGAGADRYSRDLKDGLWIIFGLTFAVEGAAILIYRKQLAERGLLLWGLRKTPAIALNAITGVVTIAVGSLVVLIAAFR